MIEIVRIAGEEGDGEVPVRRMSEDACYAGALVDSINLRWVGRGGTMGLTVDGPAPRRIARPARAIVTNAGQECRIKRLQFDMLK